jgi:hypothetical protein
MSQVLSFGRLEARAVQLDKAPAPDAPFRIAVLGDFSARASRGAGAGPAELLRRKPVVVTADTLDDVLAKYKVSLDVPLDEEGETAALTFSCLDDFLPDEIHDRVDRFEDLDSAAEKTALMNGLLHHPDVQCLEAAWRGLDWLLRRVVKGGVEVVLYDVTQDELAADLTASDDLAASATYQLLIEQAVLGPRGQPWGLLLGHYAFDITPAHADLLGRLARIARQAGAPFLAGAPSRLLAAEATGDDEGGQAWAALRQLPEAGYLGLALPRFLLRPPFGERTRSIDRFSYEEQANPPETKVYLWGNAALACAALLGQAFQKQGWALKPGSILDLPGMALHVYVANDEEQVTVAEAWLSKPQTERLVKLGFMPLLPVRGRDAMQLYRFLSLAPPAKGQQASDLLGRWGQKAAAPPARATAPPAVSVGLAAADGQAPAEEATANGEATAPAATEEAAAPAEEALDPELAALLGQLDQPAAAAPPAAAPPPEEAMDPELAALLDQLDQPAAEPPPAAAPPPEEAMDPELAALLGQVDQPAAEPPPAAAPPPEEAMDPELAALLGQLDQPAAAAPPAAGPPAEEAMDPELAALMAQLETGTSTPAEAAAPEELPAQVEALGGQSALEALGWPMFVPAFAEDLPRQLDILQNQHTNQAVAKEVADLVKKYGGYPALQAEAVSPDQGLNEQLARLRQIKKDRERQAVLRDPEIEAMARAYGASLKSCRTDEDKIELALKLKEYDRWASDARTMDLAAALDGTPFRERRQAFLEQQLQALGGDSAHEEWVAAHPEDGGGDSSLEEKVALLRLLREFNRLGGQDAYLEKAAGTSARPDSLAARLEMLKAVLACQR